MTFVINADLVKNLESQLSEWNFISKLVTAAWLFSYVCSNAPIVYLYVQFVMLSSHVNCMNN